jgi:hypothetical protein
VAVPCRAFAQECLANNLAMVSIGSLLATGDAAESAKLQALLKPPTVVAPAAAKGSTAAPPTALRKGSNVSSGSADVDSLECAQDSRIMLVVVRLPPAH